MSFFLLISTWMVVGKWFTFGYYDGLENIIGIQLWVLQVTLYSSGEKFSKDSKLENRERDRQNTLKFDYKSSPFYFIS